MGDLQWVRGEVTVTPPLNWTQIIPLRTDSPTSRRPQGGEKQPSHRPVFLRRPSRI